MQRLWRRRLGGNVQTLSKALKVAERLRMLRPYQFWISPSNRITLRRLPIFSKNICIEVAPWLSICVPINTAASNNSIHGLFSAIGTCGTPSPSDNCAWITPHSQTTHLDLLRPTRGSVLRAPRTDWEEQARSVRRQGPAYSSRALRHEAARVRSESRLQSDFWTLMRGIGPFFGPRKSGSPAVGESRSLGYTSGVISLDTYLAS